MVHKQSASFLEFCLASILEPQIAIKNVIRPNHRPNRYVCRVSAANTGNNSIGYREFNSGVETQCHYGCGGLGSSDSSDHAEYSVLVQAHMVIAGGKRKNLVEMLTFHPKLKFARSVIGGFPRSNIVTMTTSIRIGPTAAALWAER